MKKLDQGRQFEDVRANITKKKHKISKKMRVGEVIG